MSATNPDRYFTILQPSSGLYKDKGSRFIGYAYPVHSEEDVKLRLAALRKEHTGARHFCYAYRIGSVQQTYRSNDDGEPAGSAGKPILGQLQSHELSNVLLVVVRYFGGTLLGVSGLIQAYKGAAAHAIEQAQLVEQFICNHYRIVVPFEQLNEAMRIVKAHKINVTGQTAAEKQELTVAVRLSDSEKILAIFKKNSNLDIHYLRTE